VYDPPGVSPETVNEPFAGAHTVGLLAVIVMGNDPAIVMTAYVLHELPAADVINIVSVPGDKLSVKLAVTPVKD
jgi:hypothetical protein